MTTSVSGPFVSLHNHTEMGSPLDGMNRIDEIFARAKEVDHPALAITDHGTLTAHYDCWEESKKTGVKFIPGIEAYFADDLSEKKSNHMVLLAQNEAGYRNILKLSYWSYKNQASGYMGKMTPRISWEHISKWNEGVVCLTACSNGLIAKTLITEENEEKALCHIDRLNHIFKDRFFLEIQPHALYAVGKNGRVVDQQRLNEAMVRISNDRNIPYVITCDAHYRDKEHARYHDFMLAIKDKKPVNDPNRFRYGVQDMYLKTHEEIIDFFGSEIATIGMSNSLKISNSCENPTYLESRGPVLPKFPVADERDYDKFKDWHLRACSDVEEDKAYLRYKCIEGFKNKLAHKNGGEKKEAWSRVKKELSVLENRDFSSYMLIVADYINWAKDRGMPVGPARGSAAGSLVAFLSGITSVNPLDYGLIFERFHNKEKESFPDIDTDFADPGLVKDYLKEKYGEDRVASISNWSTLSPKVIVKDVARSLQLGGDKSSAFKIANHITSIMPDTKTIEEAMEISTEFRSYMKKYPELLEYSKKLQGLTRNWSVHAAGVVIGDRPLYEMIPLRIDSKTGLTITQWEKKRCEKYGLVKMDLLGLKTLTVMDECLNLISEQLGDPKINMEEIPLDDKETYNMISRGETAGVFQLESSLTPLCRRIKPKNLEGISAINALGRPSCLPATREKYIKRELGIENVSVDFENLKRALEITNGILLYEESALYIAQDCAGWDLNEADALRKISKLKGSNLGLVEKTELKFVRDCMKHSNLSFKDAKYIWDEYISVLGGYAFNKSHSISYSHISVYTAWLRNKYPTQFMCSLLNSEDPNSDKAQEYLNECRRMKIKVIPPDIRISGPKYVMAEEGVIVTGLSAIKGVGQTAIDNILESRPFNNFIEFLALTDGRTVNKRVIQSLAKAGAFDSFGLSRKYIFDSFAKDRTRVNNKVKKIIKLLVEGGEISNNEDFSIRDHLEEINSVTPNDAGEEWDKKNILLYEKEILGRCYSGSLHEIFGSFFKVGSSNVTFLNEIPNCKIKSKVKIEVIINNKVKEFTIKNGPKVGQKFAKYSIEDLKGNTSEMTVWSHDYSKYKEVFQDGTPIKAICQVTEYMGVKSLALTTLERRI